MHQLDSFITGKQQYLLHEALQHYALVEADKTAIVVDGESYTYRDLDECSANLAAGLLQRGLRRGDRVAIFMENSWHCVVAIYGVLKAGGVFVVINPQTKGEKLAFILNDCSVRHLLAEYQLAPVYKKALSHSTTLTHLIVSGGNKTETSSADGAPEHVYIEELLESNENKSTKATIIPLDLAALIYTSGSTGHPKGVMQTHQSMLFATKSIIEYLRMDSSDIVVNVLPLAFDYGLYQLLMCIQLGATLVLERSFTYYLDVLQRVKNFEVTTFPGVPTIYSMIMAAHARKPLCFPAVTRITNTAAALPIEYIPRLRELFPNALIYSMYGLTECKRVSFLEPEMIEKKPDSVGKAIPGTEAYILDSAGVQVPPGDRGILHVRGPHIMRGYWNRPDETLEMLVEGTSPGEKVLRTGDWFHMDVEGYLYFEGRSDDIIKCRGEKISPLEIEFALCNIPGVAEAAVIGVEDETLGQAILAYVVEEGSVKLETRTLKCELAKKLENFMIPRDIIITERLPMNQNYKISKKELV